MLRLSWRWLNPSPPLPSNLKPYERFLARCTHAALAIALGLTVSLHIAGALKHHFVLQDDTLRRMLPFGRITLAVLAAMVLRGVARTVTAPFTWRTATVQGRSVGYLSGQMTLPRLDFGVGQGQWQSTEFLGNDVIVRYSLVLRPSRRP